MEEALSRPAFSRIKHVLPEEAQLDAFPNHRHHYSLYGFLQKRRGGGGSSEAPEDSSRSSNSASSSLGSKPSAPKSTPVTVGESSSKPKSRPPIGGTAPSKPKSPVVAPPKAPTLPKLPNLPKLPDLPKPKSGWKPPKGSLPGYTPGHPPYHGSGGHLPSVDGSQHHSKNHPPSTHSCIHPTGFARLRCEKPDALILTIIAIIALILTPFLLYMCIRSCQQRKTTKRKNSHEEEGIELTGGVMDCDPSPPPPISDRGGSSNNIGLALSTSEETFTLAKEHMDDRCNSEEGSSPRGTTPSGVRQPRARNLSPGRRSPGIYPPRSSLSRGRRPFRRDSIGSVASSLSSGMIRTAILGQALQDATIIDLPLSLAGSRGDSERMCDASDADVSNDGDEGKQDSVEEGEGCDGGGHDGHEGVESPLGFSGQRSISLGRSDQPDSNVGTLGDTASRCSLSSPVSPGSCTSGDEVYFSPGSEPEQAMEAKDA